MPGGAERRPPAVPAADGCDDDFQADLNAWIDGALPPLTAARLGRRVAARPDVAARAAAYRAQIDGLHALYDPVLDEPIPDALLVRVRAARRHDPRSPQPRGAFVGVLSAAVAASVGTVVLGMLLLHSLAAGVAAFAG